jgi:hypothetical protein
MRQPFRLLPTGSRTWDDTHIVEHALAVILAHHPEGVLLVHGACPRGADAITAACADRTPGYHSEAHPAPGTVTAGPPDTCGTSRWSHWVQTAASRSCEAPVPAPRPPSG